MRRRNTARIAEIRTNTEAIKSLAAKFSRKSKELEVAHSDMGNKLTKAISNAITGVKQVFTADIQMAVDEVRTQIPPPLEPVSPPKSLFGRFFRRP